MENGSIQVSAPTVEEAIKRGLARLRLSRDKVDVEIVDHGSRGLLGIGARDAVVRLQPLPPAPTPKEEMQPIEEPKPTIKAVSQEPKEEPEPERAPVPEKPAQEPYAYSKNQEVEIARQALSELLSQMGIECQVVVRKSGGQEEDSPIALDVAGDDLNFLIGRRGEVLNALQYITRLIVSREVEHWVNLVVDIDRYKERRAKSLMQLATNIAERVARTKQPVALEPMPPNERRTIHIALRSHPQVTTQSVGKGEKRKVTIIPKR